MPLILADFRLCRTGYGHLRQRAHIARRGAVTSTKSIEDELSIRNRDPRCCWRTSDLRCDVRFQDMAERLAALCPGFVNAGGHSTGDVHRAITNPSSTRTSYVF